MLVITENITNRTIAYAENDNEYTKRGEKMQEIYKNALRKARQMVFDNDKYSEIIAFCKYKINKNIYTRNESTKVWPNGTEAETRVFVTCREAKNFDDYKQHRNETNQQTTKIF